MGNFRRVRTAALVILVAASFAVVGSTCRAETPVGWTAQGFLNEYDSGDPMTRACMEITLSAIISSFNYANLQSVLKFGGKDIYCQPPIALTAPQLIDMLRRELGKPSGKALGEAPIPLTMLLVMSLTFPCPEWE